MEKVPIVPTYKELADRLEVLEESNAMILSSYNALTQLLRQQGKDRVYAYEADWEDEIVH